MEDKEDQSKSSSVDKTVKTRVKKQCVSGQEAMSFTDVQSLSKRKSRSSKSESDNFEAVSDSGTGDLTKTNRIPSRRHHHHNHHHHGKHDHHHQLQRKEAVDPKVGGDVTRREHFPSDRNRVCSVVHEVSGPRRDETERRTSETSPRVPKIRRQHKRCRKDSSHDGDEKGRNKQLRNTDPYTDQLTAAHDTSQLYSRRSSPRKLSSEFHKKLNKASKTESVTEEKMIPVVDLLFKRHTSRTSLSSDNSFEGKMKTESAYLVNKILKGTNDGAEVNRTSRSDDLNELSLRKTDHELEEGEVVDSDDCDILKGKKMKPKQWNRSKKRDDNQKCVDMISYTTMCNKNVEVVELYEGSVAQTETRSKEKYEWSLSNQHKLSDRRKTGPGSYVIKEHRPEGKRDRKHNSTRLKCLSDENSVKELSTASPLSCLSAAVRSGLSVNDLPDKTERESPTLEDGEIGSLSDSGCDKSLRSETDIKELKTDSDMSISSDDDNKESGEMKEQVIPPSNRSETSTLSAEAKEWIPATSACPHLVSSSWAAAAAHSHIQQWPVVTTGTYGQLGVGYPGSISAFMQSFPNMVMPHMNHVNVSRANMPAHSLPYNVNLLQPASQQPVGHHSSFQAYSSSSSSYSLSTHVVEQSSSTFYTDREFGQDFGSKGMSFYREYSSKTAKTRIQLDLSDNSHTCPEMTRTHRRWHNLGDQDKPPGSMEFTVMTYNILSQELMTHHSELYYRCKESHLEWSNRGAALIRQIIAHSADIVCLQEVQEDHWALDIHDSLRKHGYAGEYKKKGDEKVDGCAILYKTTKFKLLKTVPVDFSKGGILDRDNVGLIMLLQPREEVYNGKIQKLCVATTHLLFNPRRGDIKLAQLMVFLAEIDKHAYMGDLTSSGAGNSHMSMVKDDLDSEQGSLSQGSPPESSVTCCDQSEDDGIRGPSDSDTLKLDSTPSKPSIPDSSKTDCEAPQYCPIILCGDFNSEPFSELYKFIIKGWLQYEDLIPRLVSGQKEGRYGGSDREIGKSLLPKTLQIYESCQYYDVLAERDRGKGKSRVSDRHQHNSGQMLHAMNFKSVYSHYADRPGPKVREVSTNHARASCTVDYIFYSRNKRRHCRKDNRDSEFSNNHLDTNDERSPRAKRHRDFVDPDASRDNTGFGNKSNERNNAEGRTTSGQDAQGKSDSTCREAAPAPEEPLKLLARYRLLTKKEVDETGCLPNDVLPSDHLCLIAKFLLK